MESTQLNQELQFWFQGVSRPGSSHYFPVTAGSSTPSWKRTRTPDPLSHPQLLRPTDGVGSAVPNPLLILTSDGCLVQTQLFGPEAKCVNKISCKKCPSLQRPENDFSLLADGRAAVQFTPWHGHGLALPEDFWSTGALRASRGSLEALSDTQEDGKEPSGLGCQLCNGVVKNQID